MIFIVIFYLFFTNAGTILMKYGSSQNSIAIQNQELSMSFNLFFIAGAICYAISFIAWAYLLGKYDLSFIYPFAISISYVIIILASYFVFDEKITGTQFVGIAFCLIGIVLMNLNFKK